MVRRIAMGVMTVGLLVTAPARADRRELYTLVGYGAGVGRYDLPANGQGSATAYAGAIDVSAYYGLSNAVHLGGRLRLTSTSDIRFAGEAVTPSDGTPVSGDVFVDHRALSVGALLEYRFLGDWVASVGVELQGEPDGLAQWVVSVPLRLGRIW